MTVRPYAHRRRLDIGDDKADVTGFEFIEGDGFGSERASVSTS